MQVCYATDPRNEKIYKIRQLARLGSDQIVPPDAGAKVTVVTVDGIGAYQEDGKTPLTGNHVDQEFPPSENDYCIGFLIEFGDFRYVTAGDLDGEYAVSAFGYSYNDVESVMAKRVTKLGADVLHVNHHGSSHSSNNHYLDSIDAQASLIRFEITVDDKLEDARNILAGPHSKLAFLP